MTLAERVRHIEIRTKRLSENVFSGEYRSSFKGRGMSFSEVREYAPGDDVRDIDWNVTARTGKPYMKVYEEERELTVMLLVDLSGSMSFGTSQASQRETAAEVAATLAFSAMRNGDRVGVLLFSDRIEKFIPARKGRKHVAYIIRELLSFEPAGRGTDMVGSLEYFLRMMRRRCVCFLLSDMASNKDFMRPLTIAAKKHDLVALRIFDERMRSLPDVGLIKIEDAETGKIQYLDTSSKKVRSWHSDIWKKTDKSLKDRLRKGNVDFVDISTSEDYVAKLIAFFKNR